MNKGIIILGSAASGKSYFEKELYDYLYNIKYKHEFRVNPDFYVEDEDSKFYNNPIAASNYVYKTIIPEIIELNSNFILQNTGANTKTLRKIIDTPNYQFKAVVVYCNPIIAFIRNFSRERKLPKQILLENWLKVYSQIKDYQDIFGEDNIYIYETEYTPEEITILSFYNTFNNFLINNPGAYDSTFKKIGTNYSKEELLKRELKLNGLITQVDNKLKDFNKNNNFLTPVGVSKEYIKEELNKWIN
jgi:hypothetical protein